MLDFNKARNLDIKIIAENLGIKFNEYNKCCCIVHTEKTPSMVIYNNHLKCHVGHCNSYLSTIDLYMLIKNITEIQAVKELLETYAIPYLEKKKSPSNNSKGIINTKKTKSTKVDIPYLLKNSTKIDNINSNKFVLNYFTGRCIPRSIDLLKNNFVDVYYNSYGSSESILYYFKKHKFIIQKGFNKINSKKNTPMNHGTPFPSFFKVNNSKVVYICEGIEDSLSFLHNNKNSISLNSTNNTKKFLNILNTWKQAKEYTYIIATDNDKAGFKCKKELEEYFKNNNFSYAAYEEHIKSNVNDVNELFIKLSKNKN